MEPPLPPDPLGYYRAALFRHFEQNRGTVINPDAAFVYGFSDDQLAELEGAISSALKQLGRPFGIVHCAGKTDRQIYRDAVHSLQGDLSANPGVAKAAKALEQALLHGACTLVVEQLSQAKSSKRIDIARDLIKTLDDAHFGGIRPMSDILFIDRASFLERAWPAIGTYVRLVGPFDVVRSYLDSMADDAERPPLMPV